MTDIAFALNHMTVPKLTLPAFFDLAMVLGMTAVEIRNDLAGNAVTDCMPAETVQKFAARRNLPILAINALQRFNEWNAGRATEARELAAYACKCGARGLVLVPVNDGSGREEGIRQASLRKALRELRPVLADAGLAGFVEPLGFPSCSLRFKSEAAEAIGAVDGAGVFHLVHDTFHHHLAGEAEFYPAQTGLVHISGVADTTVAVDDMQDAHRILVDSNDRVGNTEQIRALLKGGCAGPFSFEVFAASVHELADPAPALAVSMARIRALL